MRSHSGTDESRNNLRDPTLRERDKQAEARKAAKAGGRSTGMGSNARKSGQDGADSDR